MQPDGADLEYIYRPSGGSRGVSASPTGAPAHAAWTIPASGALQPLPRYAALLRRPEEDWAAAVHVAADAGRRRLAHFSRPHTAGNAMPVWDDSPAGVPPRTRSQDIPAGLARCDHGLRPISAGTYKAQHAAAYTAPVPALHTPEWQEDWRDPGWATDTSPYVRQSFMQAQRVLRMEPAVLASSGGGAWAGAACDQFQAPNGTGSPLQRRRQAPPARMGRQTAARLPMTCMRSMPSS
jgi:hypothetical protein